MAQPKTANLLADMLEMTITQFVLIIQRYALPYLVIAGNRDVIQKIAELRREAEPWQPCLDADNVGPILALLLVRKTHNIPENSMAMLSRISSHFEELALVDLLKIEPVMTSLELLKAAGDADEPRKTHVSRVAQIIRSFLTVVFV